MRIKSIQVNGYRSFNSCDPVELPDTKHPISIIGYNGAGKSNFIRAIRHGVCDLNSFQRSFRPNDFHKLKDGEISIKIVFDDAPVSDPGAFGQFKEMPVIKLVAEKKNDFTVNVRHNFYDTEEKAIYIPQATKISDKRLATLSDDQKEAVQNLFKAGSQTVYRNKDKIPFYYVDFHQIADELNTSSDSLLSKKLFELIKTFEADANVSTHEDRHKGKPRKEIFELCVEYLNEHILTSPEIEEFVAEFKDLLINDLKLNEEAFSAQFQNPDYDRILRAVRFKVSDGEEVPSVPIEHLGGGMSALVGVTLLQILLNVKDGGQVIVIEEPETFLHEHYQSFFYKVLRRLAQKNQVIISTHSRNFLDIFKPETIIRVTKNKNNESSLIKGRAPSIDQDELEPQSALNNISDFGRYLRTIEPNIGSALFARKVVIVEGPHDLLVYKTIYQDIVEANINNIAFVAAWGKLPVALLGGICKSFEIDVFAIHDEDLSSEDRRVLKAQTTINSKIARLFSVTNVHVNSSNLETVLGIDKRDKGALAAYQKISGLDYRAVKEAYPGLIDQNLEYFLEIEPRGNKD